MRYLAAAALIAAHLALLAVPGELLAPGLSTSPIPTVTGERFAAGVARVPEVPAAPPESLTVADLDQLAAGEDSLMREIQRNGENVAALTELAYLYLRHGWSAQAIGPLARAVAVLPGRDELRFELLLAVKLSGRAPEDVDVTAEARQFMDSVAMWGHAC